MTDLSGLWNGSYIYPGSLEPVPFNAELRDTDGLLSGVIAEPTAEWAGPGEVAATLSGRRRGNEVEFVKLYDQVDAYPDPVHYAGTLDEEECEIAGSWVISGNWSGAFVMTRPQAKAGELAVEAEEKLPLDR